MDGMTSAAKLFVLVFYLMVFAYAANANVIYNNLDSRTDFNSGFFALDVQADSFTVPAAGSSWRLERVGIKLRGDPLSGGKVSVDLVRSPDEGSLLHIGTLSDALLSSTYTDFFFSPGGFRLQPGQRYWIEVSHFSAPRFDNSLVWGASLDQAAVGVSGEFFFNRGFIFANEFGPYQMEVDVRRSSPELGTFLLLASGLLSSRWWYGRRYRHG